MGELELWLFKVGSEGHCLQTGRVGGRAHLLTPLGWPGRLLGTVIQGHCVGGLS